MRREARYPCPLTVPTARHLLQVRNPVVERLAAKLHVHKLLAA
jgi:hypothetical protein